MGDQVHSTLRFFFAWTMAQLPFLDLSHETLSHPSLKNDVDDIGGIFGSGLKKGRVDTYVKFVMEYDKYEAKIEKLQKQQSDTKYKMNRRNKSREAIKRYSNKMDDTIGNLQNDKDMFALANHEFYEKYLYSIGRQDLWKSFAAEHLRM